MADFGDEPGQHLFHLLSLNRPKFPRLKKRGDRSMPDKLRSWDSQAPTPTSQPLDFEEIQRGSPLAYDALGGTTHYNNIESDYAVAEVEDLYDGASFEIVPSTFNTEGLPAISGWLTDSWIPDDSQSPLGMTDYGCSDHYAAPVAPTDGQEAQFDLPGLHHPDISPSSLCHTQTVNLDTNAYMPFLDSGESSLYEPLVQTKTQAIPVQNPNRPASLPRRRSQYSLRRLGQISSGRYTPTSISSLDPMQRWQESPPEDEPASLSAIMQAVNKSERIGKGLSVDEGLPTRPNASFRHHRRPASLASSRSGTSASSWQSSASTRSAVSTPRSQSGSTRVGKSKRKPKKPSGLDHDRIFCCTFCCDTFKNKFDWSRHEKSLHLNLGGWACTPHGGSALSTVTGRMHCVYCNSPEPTPEHLDGHNHFQCSDSTRIFRRKDHLVQHLRLVHSLESLPVIDDWKILGPTITSRCGFCDQRLQDWDERADHLTNHFRQGMTMSDWKGDHDFPPAIAAQVINSLPPYLLSWESGTMVPFSASNRTAQDHLAQISARANWVAANASAQAQNEQQAALQPSSQLPPVGETMVPLNTFTGILTQHLSRYARQQMSMGIIPTDEMFQQESRKLLYDSEDSWNQSIADNPAWISAFRQQLQVQPGNNAPAGADQLEDTTAGFSFKQ